MIDFSNATETSILKLYKNGDIGPYYTTWILSKLFNKGYKSISDFSGIGKTITTDIKHLSQVMYKSKVFSKDVISILTTKLDSLDEKIIKKLVAVSKAIYWVESVDYRKKELKIEIIVRYKNGNEDILSQTIKKMILPNFDSVVFKLILKSKNGMKDTLSKLDKKDLLEIKNHISPKKDDTSRTNYVDDILSSFD